MLETISSAIKNPTETASALTSTIHSTFTNTSSIIAIKFQDKCPNISRNISENYSNLSNKVADQYNKLNEVCPGWSSSLTNPGSTITSTFSNGTTYVYSLPASLGGKFNDIFQQVDDDEGGEIIRSPPNDNLNENVMKLDAEKVEIVNSILDLYSCKPSKESFKNYDDNVIFEDPIMYTIGLSNLKAQFYGTPKISLKCTKISYKILENKLENKKTILKIELERKYTLPFVHRAIVLYNTIILELNDDMKITKHTDLWYGRPVGKEGIFRKSAAKFVSTIVKVPEN